MSEITLIVYGNRAGGGKIEATVRLIGSRPGGHLPEGAALRKFPRVASAALLRKRLRHFPESPLYVLGVRIRRQGWARVSTQATSVMHALVAGLRLPGDWICFPLDLLTRIGAKRFEEAAGGAFYRAETPPQPSPYLRGYSHSEDA